MSLINLVNAYLMATKERNTVFYHNEIIKAVQNEVERICGCSDIGEHEKSCYIQHIFKIAEELVVQQKKYVFLSNSVGFLNELSKTIMQDGKDK